MRNLKVEVSELLIPKRSKSREEPSFFIFASSNFHFPNTNPIAFLPNIVISLTFYPFLKLLYFNKSTIFLLNPTLSEVFLAKLIYYASYQNSDSCNTLL